MELGLCIEMALANLPFEDRLQKAADLGFRYVEMWFVDGTYQGRPDQLAKAAERNHVRISNTVIGSPDGSVGGGLTNPAHREQWLERARTTIAFTREAQIPATIVCTGNTVQGMTDEQMRASVMEGLKPTLEMAEEAGIVLLLEPLNSVYDHPGYWLTSSDRGAAICRELASSPRHMRLLFDCYHMQIMEGDLVKHIERHLDVIGHVHSAGVPGRHEIYNGEVNYAYVFKAIEAMSYKGLFGLEYEPSMDDEVSLKNTLEYLGV
ncbi:MAG: TIM barrel protein [Candidatus Hydrogenedentes bacterium]|nr:TIM barrel protein [Candidatus Hydrogenedentota bacterium]